MNRDYDSDIVELDPFKWEFTGKHACVTLRTNTEHVEAACKAIRLRRQKEVQFSVEPAKRAKKLRAVA